ncbi:hypothetical protein EJ03DRAFT_9502 [Teratosphaeria nubilosa]|uniref:Uncharacterized protein n=1 Tax=Teratosphaeria nubilosa TaxID=161662 RepID=A0A6G1LGX3_9PEZI|nr:hypothetical protein EJ03DRAFT_9502 [Teratosphaeria nubilosa]
MAQEITILSACRHLAGMPWRLCRRSTWSGTALVGHSRLGSPRLREKCMTRQQPKIPTRVSSQPQDHEDVDCLTLNRELEICRRHLDYMHHIDRPRGLDLVSRDLRDTVFGLEDSSRVDLGKARDGGPGAEMWVLAHAYRLGASIFWFAWCAQKGMSLNLDSFSVAKRELLEHKA